MKRRKLIKTLEEMGCILILQGSNHDWYQNPENRNVPTNSETSRY
jgi:hypothetical protein